MERRLATLATCSLNQLAMDFKWNMHNIICSVKEAKEKGARYRIGPELEIPGYSCEDHFLEPDTVHHSWEVLANILSDPGLTKDIICEFGMPVQHKDMQYNC